MEPIATSRSGRASSCERLVAIVLTVVAVFSPLYIDRKLDSDWEDDEQSINLVSWLPLLLLVLILAIALSLFLDQSYTS
ncbi:hypothetical protein Ddye_020210 [Dipteronia dyeriana]|uniref:Transmembrane protein n=1 Tax=Dipteronia dyeriana TaxID=168575 RepID=A0AAD9WWU3_9ROSI|nr:hypothetical protein Ddye_020210 [Dipteronia dyeriana]